MAEEYYALITGAGKGIGRAMANEMASRGHNLILNSLPGEGLDLLCASLMKTYNIKALYFEIDLTAADGPLSLFRYAKDNGLDVNILINNAGTGIQGPIESYSQQTIDAMILLNIRALTLLTYYFTPELKKRLSYLLNISSYGCYSPAAYKSVYLATKSYIYYLTRALESEFKGTNVRTCLLIPGGVRTNEMISKRIEQIKRIARVTILEPGEVASAGIKGMFKGKKIIIPGRLVRFIFAISTIIPEGIVMAATRNLFRRTDSL
jgi:short-subunit dehydrogenase